MGLSPFSDSGDGTSVRGNPNRKLRVVWTDEYDPFGKLGRMFREFAKLYEIFGVMRLDCNDNRWRLAHMEDIVSCHIQLSESLF
jgi:hypothetical protein